MGKTASDNRKNFNWHNKNECVDINVQINASTWTEMPDVECSEVMLINTSQDFVISTTEPAGASSPTEFFCKQNEYHTIKGLSNMNEMSAKGESSTNTLYGRTQSYGGYYLAVG